jgi:hypothetical protein
MKFIHCGLEILDWKLKRVYFINILDSLVEFKAIKMGENAIWEDIDNRVI